AAAYAFPARGTEATGSAGIDTSIPATDSQVTVSGRGKFSDLKVTVNQTKNLLNQAISLTWKGGAPTAPGPAVFARNYLQFMQCWGDEDGSNPDNPGPPPEQCAQGATEAVFGGRGDGLFPSGSFSATRIISNKSWENFDPNTGSVDENSGHVYRDFRSVKGPVVGVPVDANFNPDAGAGSYWRNPYFDVVTTNEIAGARTLSNGTGSELFEVHTGLEDAGLGCGQSVQPVAGGTKVPKCWLVVVPRGTPTEENVGTPAAGDSADQSGVVTSPVATDPWKNRIAIPLEFNPVDPACKLGDDQRRIIGSELAAAAIASWQPALCDKPGRSPYSFATISDANARQQLNAAAPGSPGMVVVSRPIDESFIDADNPVVYAPVTLSGIVFGFNVERNTDPNADAAAKELTGVRVAKINLTPRLVAKLLTQSYRDQVAIKQDPKYDWLTNNPANLGKDKDFLQFNPEFKELLSGGKNFSGFVMPVSNSDAARQVWEYVLADPEARAWIDGAPDQFGTKVNPVYRTKAIGGGVPPFGDPRPESFPKNDPFCYQAPAFGPGGSLIPPPLCGPDWLPPVAAFRDAARATRLADDGAKVIENPFANSADKYYTRDLPQPLGIRAILSIADAASAFQYGVQTASLSRAGDNDSDRKFIAATAASFAAGIEAMKPSGDLGVLEPEPTAKAANGYPLTALTYAAIKPLALDATARSDYADFIDYASDKGQVSGLKFGQLPNGYAPLPAALKTQSANAAKKVRELTAAAAQADEASGGDTASGGSDAGRSAFSPSDLGSFGGSFANGDPATATSPAVNLAAPGNKRVVTPAVAVPFSRFALPALALLAALAALGALEITKRPRRAVS
ncbi:MAG: hypothetical protein H0U92_04965, partial [Actinobacteria bacterium]|nr:hypothetical protein [Actinomycetota bacterium]